MPFVIKVYSKLANPRWLNAGPEGDTRDFGPRDVAIAFGSRSEAEAEAEKWKQLLSPALTVEIEAISADAPLR